MTCLFNIIPDGRWVSFFKSESLSGDILYLCLKGENRLVQFLRDSLLKKKFISDAVYRDLCPTGSTPEILCGLPKVHRATVLLDLFFLL